MSVTHSPESALGRRVEALGDAIELARGRLPEPEVRAAEELLGKAAERLRHGTHHTVVAIAGATGSGKSSIVNRLAGTALSDAGVLRPTTSITHAAVWGDRDAGPLLDWLEVTRRHQVDDGDPALDGLVLLDLPDHDSTAVEHRLEVDRLVRLVDVLVWVTDPQKYADEALHRGYVAPLADHARVLRFVLNQTDRLDDGGAAILPDLERLLRADGIEAPTVLPVSALTGAGFDRLGELLVDAVERRQAAVERLGADLHTVASAMQRHGTAAEPAGKARRGLIAGLAEAAGAGPAAEIAAAHHRRQGSLAMGWPFTRFVRRWGRMPLAQLPGPGRTGAASEARMDLAVRDYADAVADELEAPWPKQVRRTAASERDLLLDDLRALVGKAAVGAGRRPRWWTAIEWLQRAFAGVAVVGLAWLLAVAVLGGFFRFDTEPLLPDTPGVDWFPLPTALLLGGVVAGLVTSLLARVPLGIAARRRGRAARKEMEKAVVDAAHTRVVAPVEALLADRRRLSELLEVAGGGGPL